MNKILQYWSFDLPSLIIFLLLIIAYFFDKKDFSGIRYFLSALLLMVICFFSPLHVLSSLYLFSAHMAVHVMLLLLVGPLLVLSFSTSSKKFAGLFIFLKKYPGLGWMAAVGTMWIWHVPYIFSHTMKAARQPGFAILPVFETLSLIISGILFSSPVIHPNKEFRIEALPAVLYLFTACVGCSLLGLLITFAPAGTYHHFLSVNDPFSLNQIITGQWKISQVSDQQAAGLIMWVPCCFIYVAGAMYLLLKWLMEKEESIVQLKNIS